MTKPRKILSLLVLVFGLILGNYLLLSPTSFFDRAFGQPADLYVDVGSSFALPGKVWKNLAQGGEEDGRMLESVIGPIAKLSPEYIRIDHVFDYYGSVKKDQSGNIIFDWTGLDLTLNDILSTGAKPFVALSYMPLSISSGDVNDLPNNWQDWELCVKALIEHISGKSALGVSDVYYEVWNEPDLFGKFKVSGEKNYLDLYYHASKGATSANNVLPFKLGGPATTGLDETWVKAVFDFALKNSLKLDFISWHRYTMDLDRFEKDALEAKTWVADYPEGNKLELVVSEAGHNSENNKDNDGSFSAISTIAQAAVLENEITRLFTFEIKDGPGNEKYWGRWGILTHEKFGPPEAKPRYQAIQFLNRMVGNKMNVAGQGSWVKAFAKEDNGVIRLLVVNYDTDAKHHEAVPITLANLPFLNFNFKRIDFNGQTNTLTVKSDSATWKVMESFNPNSAAIFEITPI